MFVCVNPFQMGFTEVRGSACVRFSFSLRLPTVRIWGRSFCVLRVWERVLQESPSVGFTVNLPLFVLHQIWLFGKTRVHFHLEKSQLCPLNGTEPLFSVLWLVWGLVEVTNEDADSKVLWYLVLCSSCSMYPPTTAFVYSFSSVANCPHG